MSYDDRVYAVFKCPESRCEQEGIEHHVEKVTFRKDYAQAIKFSGHIIDLQAVSAKLTCVLVASEGQDHEMRCQSVTDDLKLCDHAIPSYTKTAKKRVFFFANLEMCILNGTFEIDPLYTVLSFACNPFLLRVLGEKKNKERIVFAVGIIFLI